MILRAKLYLAPMEGIGDHHFRRAMACVGGFDEASTEFLRVPRNACIRALAKKYCPDEMEDHLMAVQLMGEDANLLAEMTVAVVEKGAPRVDLNCGCPSNTVVGKGAGSSLLQTPEKLYQIASAMVAASTVPVSVKIRSGYADNSLFDEILEAVEASGAAHIAIHPRTKVEGYGPPARWELIGHAVGKLKIPVVGSGDVLSVADANRMVDETGCAGVMIGRGILRNPYLFHQIRADWRGEAIPCGEAARQVFLKEYYASIAGPLPDAKQMSRLKGMLRFMFGTHELLRDRTSGPGEFFEKLLEVAEKSKAAYPVGSLKQLGETDESTRFSQGRSVQRGQDCTPSGSPLCH